MARRTKRHGSHHVGKGYSLPKMEKAMGQFLSAAGIDWRHDPQMQETPKRFAKAWVNDLARGRYQKEPKIKFFPNDQDYSQLIFVGPLQVTSMCAHHLLGIDGYAFVGILPGEGSKLPGLSKYARIVNWLSERPQIQEGLTKQILDYLVVKTQPAAAMVRITAKHMCMCHRGVRQQQSLMTTSAPSEGAIRDRAIFDEFLAECRVRESNLKF